MNGLTSCAEKGGMDKEDKVVVAVMSKLCEINPKCLFHNEPVKVAVIFGSGPVLLLTCARL